MATNYPGSLDTTATHPAAGSVGANLSTFPHSTLHGNANDAVIAIETELGTAPSGSETTVKARLDRITPTLGALTTWTPTVTQFAVVTVTVTRATYQRVGRRVWCTFRVAATGAGNGANPIIIGGLPFTAAYASGTVGAGGLYDVSAPAFYGAVICMNSTTTLALQTGYVAAAADARLGVSIFNLSLASGDIIDGTFEYEAAADA